MDFTSIGTHTRQRLCLGFFQRLLTPGRFEHRSANRVTFRISSGDGSRLLRRRSLRTATGRLRLAMFARRVFLLATAVFFGTTRLARAAGRRFSVLHAKAKVLDRAVRTTANEMRNAGQQCRSCCRPHDQNCGYVLNSAHVSPMALWRDKAGKSIATGFQSSPRTRVSNSSSSRYLRMTNRALMIPTLVTLAPPWDHSRSNPLF